MPAVVSAGKFSGWTRGEMITALAQTVGASDQSTEFKSAANLAIKRAIAKIHGHKRWRFQRSVDIEYTLKATVQEYQLDADDGIPGLVDVMYIGQKQFPFSLHQLTLDEYMQKIAGFVGSGVPDAWFPITETRVMIYPKPDTNATVFITCNLGLPNITDDSQRGPWPSRYDHAFLCWAEYYIRKWRRNPAIEVREALNDANESLLSMHWADNKMQRQKSRIRHEQEDRNRYLSKRDPGRDFR